MWVCYIENVLCPLGSWRGVERLRWKRRFKYETDFCHWRVRFRFVWTLFEVYGQRYCKKQQLHTLPFPYWIWHYNLRDSWCTCGIGNEQLHLRNWGPSLHNRNTSDSESSSRLLSRFIIFSMSSRKASHSASQLILHRNAELNIEYRN